MSPQDHANHLLAIWQQRRDLPPEQRLSDAIDRFRAVGGKFAWEKDRSPSFVRVGDHDSEGVE